MRYQQWICLLGIVGSGIVGSGTAQAAHDPDETVMFYCGGSGVARSSQLQAAFDDFARTSFEPRYSVVSMESNVEFEKPVMLCVGLRKSRYWQGELAIQRVGVSYRADARVLDHVIEVPAQFSVEQTPLMYGLNVSGIWPVRPSWELYVRAGVSAGQPLDIKINATVDGVTESGNRFGNWITPINFGVGGLWHFNQSWALRLDAQRILKGVDSTRGSQSYDQYTLNLIYSVSMDFY